MEIVLTSINCSRGSGSSPTKISEAMPLKSGFCDVLSAGPSIDGVISDTCRSDEGSGEVDERQ